MRWGVKKGIDSVYVVDRNLAVHFISFVVRKTGHGSFIYPRSWPCCDLPHMRICILTQFYFAEDGLTC